MPEKKENIKTKSVPAEVGPLFDKSMLASAAVIMALLLVAMFISWLPQFFIHQPSNSTQSDQQASYPNVQNQTAAPEIQCKNFLSNGSEGYEFSYSITAGSDAAGTMDSHLSASDGAMNSTWMRETRYNLDLSQLVAEANISAAMMPSDFRFITYLDQDFRCVGMYEVMTINGQNITQPLSCDTTTTDNFVICKDDLIETGKAKITVDAGTFDVTNYMSPDDNSTLSMADIPLPIEVSIGGDRMQLISYRKVA